MLMCHYCLLATAAEEADLGLTETTIVVSEGDRHAAITIVDGEAVCLRHWTERIGNIASERPLGLGEPGWRARLEIMLADACEGPL